MSVTLVGDKHSISVAAGPLKKGMKGRQSNS